MPPTYVKPYVKRGKNDANDAEAICEAVTRPTMRFVAVKSREQQAALSIHRARDLFVKQRTQQVNIIRGRARRSSASLSAIGLERALIMAREVVEGKELDIPAAGRSRSFSRSRGKRSTRSLRIRDMERDLLALASRQ